MTHRDGIIATIAVGLGLLALSVLVNTDTYSAAARTEVSGYHALARHVSGDAVREQQGMVLRIDGARTALSSASAAASVQ